MARTADDVREVVTPLADDMGLELVEIECKGPDRRRFVRVLIHREGGASASDCRSLARQLQTHFDEQNFFFPGIYTLEVASPGLDRPLRSARDFSRNLGQRVRLFLNEPHDGKLEWVGRIADVLDDTLRLRLDPPRKKGKTGKKGRRHKRPAPKGNGPEQDFLLAQVSRGKLLIEF